MSVFIIFISILSIYCLILLVSQPKLDAIVAISGYFQILHTGHIDYINNAKKLGNHLVVIINNDKQVELKNSIPLVDENTRAKIIKSIKGVDEVIIAIDEDESVSKTLELIKPNIFLNEGDRTTYQNPKEVEICKKIGCKIVTGNNKKIESSSWIIERAAKAWIKKWVNQ